MAAVTDLPLLRSDQGIDPAHETYRDCVTAVLGSLAPGPSPHTGARVDDYPDENVQLAARTADALNEVAEWTASGQAADPTACAWLSYLRWARACGAQPPAGSPVPPERGFDRDFPRLSAAVSPAGDTFHALATGELGVVSHPIAPAAESGEVLARSVPYGLVPRVGWKALLPLVVDSAAITHGHEEAQTAAAAVALAVHASVQARMTDAPFGDVVSSVNTVIAAMTRPAPRTRALLRMAAEVSAETDLAAATAFTAALGRGTAASSALALGLGSVNVAHRAGSSTHRPSILASRADELVASHPAASPAARLVAAAVTAARWGTGVLVRDDDGVTAELEGLARQWCQRWCPH